MKLTQKQEALITRFLRDAGEHMGEQVPAATRDRVLRGLHERITAELRGMDKEAAADADILAVLAHAAAETAAAPGPESLPAWGGLSAAFTREPQRPAGLHPKAVWLGVCAGNADRFELPVWALRLLFIALGVSGPLAVIIYIALFAESYLQTPAADRPALHYGPMVWRPAASLIVALALNWGAQYALLAGVKAYEAYLNRTAPLLGDWGWIEVHGPSLFALTLAIALPFSVLSALPLANAWNYSLKRLVQATLALYGVVIAFGLASAIVGLILDAVRDFSGR
ncbi:MAG: PspC domain-containing protein [Candidatus Hydrogenedentes bacterium]|nr:PspC domain-containing protein [Candidatus Hydrogenedentota bacterium]